MANEKQSELTAGFRLLRVYFPLQSYEMIDVSDLEKDQADERTFNASIDWRIREDSHTVEVMVALSLTGKKAAPERIRIACVGEFKVANATTVALKSFVSQNGPAILFPYARHAIAELTMAGPFNIFHLPAMNIVKLMRDYDFDSSTGARQLRELPELAQRFSSETKTDSSTEEKDDGS